MPKEDFLIKQYETLRGEVNTRIKILHELISLAIIILVLYFVVFSYLLHIKADQELLDFVLLTMPVVFSFLSFNYQANQMTLEVTAKFSDLIVEKLMGKEAVSWDKYYEKYKEGRTVTSFLKVTPLLAPQFVSLIVYINIRGNSAGMFFVVDLVLFFICVINFWYKRKRQ